MTSGEAGTRTMPLDSDTKRAHQQKSGRVPHVCSPNVVSAYTRQRRAKRPTAHASVYTLHGCTIAGVEHPGQYALGLLSVLGARWALPGLLEGQSKWNVQGRPTASLPFYSHHRHNVRGVLSLALT